jgi:hypothetical protein
VSLVLKNRFIYNLLPWQYQTSGSTSVNNIENIDYVVMAPGNYHYGKMTVDVGTAKVKGDTTEVVFSQPFPEGVIPVVVTELRPFRKDYPTIARIWDITNKGFKATALFETGVGSTVTVRNPLSYMAVTPGSASVNDSILLSAGTGSSPLCTSYSRTEYFTIPDSAGGVDTLMLSDPVILASLQTYRYAAPASLRYSSLLERSSDGLEKKVCGVRVRRFTDNKASVSDAPSSADTFGWVTLSRNINSVPSRMDAVVEQKVYSVDAVYDINGRRVASGRLSQSILQLLPPGLYIKIVNGKAEKVVKLK